MRVLHVNPARTWRGGERQVLLLARNLAQQGVENVLAVDPAGVLGGRAEASGLATVRFRARVDADPAAVLAGVRMIRSVRPDLLHLHTARAHGAAGLSARIAGFRPVLVTRRVELPVRGPWGRWKYRRLADHYIAISAAVEAALRAGGVPGSRITRIPSGVELPAAPYPPRAGEAWTVGTLAAFTPQKDPATWMETVGRVAAALPEARFAWAGDGELRRSTEVAMGKSAASGRVRFPGFLEDPELFWRSVDVFFLPSAFEAMGTVLLDAMARGIPVVATRVGGIPEVVRHEREGLLAPPGDAAALATALLELRRRPELARRLGEAGRLRALDYDARRTATRTRELYDRLAGGGRNR